MWLTTANNLGTGCLPSLSVGWLVYLNKTMHQGIMHQGIDVKDGYSICRPSGEVATRCMTFSAHHSKRCSKGEGIWGRQRQPETGPSGLALVQWQGNRGWLILLISTSLLRVCICQVSWARKLAYGQTDRTEWIIHYNYYNYHNTASLCVCERESNSIQKLWLVWLD